MEELVFIGQAVSGVVERRCCLGSGLALVQAAGLIAPLFHELQQVHPSLTHIHCQRHFTHTH